MKKLEISMLAAAFVLAMVSFIWAPQTVAITGMAFGAWGMVVWDSVRRGFYRILK